MIALPVFFYALFVVVVILLLMGSLLFWLVWLVLRYRDDIVVFVRYKILRKKIDIDDFKYVYDKVVNNVEKKDMAKELLIKGHDFYDVVECGYFYDMIKKKMKGGNDKK